MTLLASSESDPLFHEAVTWYAGTKYTKYLRWIPGKLTFTKRYPPTDEVFFVQNAGAPAAGTGLNKSSIVQKISLADAEALRNGSLGAEAVTVHTVPSNPQVINPNGM